MKKRIAAEVKPFEKRTYSVDEIQDILGIGRTSAYNLAKQNRGYEEKSVNRILL